MKIKNLWILLLSLLLLRFSITVKAQYLDNQLITAQLQQTNPEQVGNLSILKAETEVGLGGIGFITIQGQPRVRYTLTSSFKIGESTRTVSQWRVTDEDGQATFVWVVNQHTVPGTYPVTISGGEKTITTYHKVMP